MGQPKNFLCGATCFAAREKTAKRRRTPDVVPYKGNITFFAVVDRIAESLPGRLSVSRQMVTG